MNNEIDKSLQNRPTDKVISLAKEIFNIGYEAGVKATNVDCGVVWEERIDAIKSDIDKQTEIHSDGEFYIKNIDVKRIIDKHCGGDTNE